jgi:hypothetical protein
MEMQTTHVLKSLSWCLPFFFWAGSFAAEPLLERRPTKFHIQGKVVDGRYYGYGGVFSMALPSKSTAAEIEDSYTAPTIGGVAFFNHSGFLLKLEIDELIPEVCYLIVNHPEIKHEILDALFYEVLLPQLKVIVPKLQLLNEQKVNLINGDDALFAVINLPEAATLIDLDSGKNLDSKRGFLLFFSNDHKELVNLSMQDTLTLIPNVAEAAKVRLNERLLNHLIQYQSTFRIEAPNCEK